MRVPKKVSFDVLPSSTALRGPTGAGGNPEAFGARVGASLTQLGGATMALATVVREQEEKKNRFNALRALSNFQTQQRMRFETSKRNAIPGSPDFYESVGRTFRADEQEFLAGLPPELQEEFRVRTAEFGGALALDALQHQYQTNDAFYKQGIQDAVDEARREVGQDASKENLERWRATVDETIASTGLSVAEQQAIRRRAYGAVEGVAYRQAQLERLIAEAGGEGTDVTQAAELLQTYYGMDEHEAADKALSGASLAQQSVGSLDTWAALPQRVRAALTVAAAANGGLTNEVVAAVSSGDVTAIANALRKQGLETEGDIIGNPEAGIDNDPAFANVAYEDRLALLADAQREAASMMAAEQQAMTQSNKSLVNALHVALYDGQAGQADIDALRERGVLTDYDDIKKSQDILAKRDEELQLRLMAQQMLAGDITFAVGNEDHMKALNALIGKEGLTAIDQKDADYAANFLIPTVRAAGAVPSDVVDLMRGMIRSQDSDRAYWALDLMQQIERANPKAINSFPAEDQKSLAVWQARKDYISQEAMMQAIRGPVDPAERNARAAMRKAGMDLFTAENGPLKNFNPKDLFTGPPGWFMGMPHGVNQSGTPWVNQQLEDDFQTLFLDAYEVTGDMESAKQVAAKQLQQVWGVTQVGADNTLMKYPPEKAYPTVQDNYQWMEQQLRDEGLIPDGENFQLIADTQTENEWGKTAPSYILVTEVNGVYQTQLDEDGLPMRVYFDYGAIQQQDEAAWRDAQRRAQTIQESEQIMGSAVKHSLETGMPIPGELFDNDQPGGILSVLMGTSAPPEGGM